MMRNFMYIFYETIGIFSMSLSAYAQSGQLYPVPPSAKYVDMNGMDLYDLSFDYKKFDKPLTIGAGAHELSRNSVNYGVRDNEFGTISYDNVSNGVGYGNINVTIGERSEKFDPSTYTNLRGSGSTLSPMADGWIYTSRDGMIAKFIGGPTSSLLYHGALYPVLGLLASEEFPDGEIRQFNYDIYNNSGFNFYLLRSFYSNVGYQIHYQYVQVTGGYVSSVTSINDAADYCDPAADGCSSLKQSWPAITYPDDAHSVDPIGRVTQYFPNFYTSKQPFAKIIRPSGYTVESSVNVNSGTATLTYGSYSSYLPTWSYSSVFHNLDQNHKYATIKDPYGSMRSLKFLIVAIGSGQYSVGVPELLFDTDSLGNTTNYHYDTYTRITEIDYPEGNSDQFVYDARGNVLKEIKTPKPGSNSPAIVLQAGYDTTCASPAKCNKPNWTKDALGNETDFSYDPTTGMLLTETRPAGPNDVRPVTAYSYGQIVTQNSVQSGLIWMQTGKATCATTAGTVSVSGLTSTLTCAGGASDLIKTTISYAGSNNALPTSVTTAAGDGSHSTTTSKTYDNIGNVLTLTDASGAVTRYRYNAARELIGIVSPSPNGGGLPCRAVRYTYSPDGLPILVEEGTVPDQSDSGWAAFSTLRKKVTTYDAQDRKVTESMVGN